MAISLDKVERQAPGLLSLAKTAATELDRRGLDGHKAKVALVLDFSGSMSARYKKGEVQRLAERVLALGALLDDDGAIDVFIFHSRAEYLGELTLADYQGGIDRLTRGKSMGSTDYAGAFRAVRDHFGFAKPGYEEREVKGLFKKKKVRTAVPAAQSPADLPVFALFVTDGAPNSKPAAEEALIEVSTAPIFWKALSVGREEMEFLQKLDDMEGRFQDNVDYKGVGEIESMSDQQVYDALLDEYPGFLTNSRALGILR